MINGIDSRNYTNPYQNNVKKVNQAGEDAPAFLLGNDENGVVWERQNEKEKKSNSEESIKKQDESPEKQAHTEKIDASNKNKESSSNKSDVDSFSNIIKRIAESLRKIIKGMANFFWYGNEKETSGGENDKLELSKIDDAEKEPDINPLEKKTEKTELTDTGKNELSEEEQDRIIRELLKNNDTEAVMDMITDHNRKQLAKNSNLLTQYDKHGSLRELSGSEQVRILTGDKVIKM